MPLASDVMHLGSLGHQDSDALLLQHGFVEEETLSVPIERWPQGQRGRSTAIAGAQGGSSPHKQAHRQQAETFGLSKKAQI